MSALISIAVIDDEPAIRNGITTIISESLGPGYHVVGQASDGFEGLEIVCRTKPDIVISDIIMPGLTGLELIGEVRKSNSRTRFIILSGYDDFRYAKEAIRLKASDYLLKPVPRTELVKAIREAAASLETGEETTREIEELQKSATILFLQRLIKGEIRNRTELNSGLTSLSIPLIDSRTTIIAMHFPDSDEVANAESVVADFAKKTNWYQLRTS
jgi:Response regulator containing CheY-like receiver domain and AraC-type DNA-binding domain